MIQRKKSTKILITYQNPLNIFITILDHFNLWNSKHVDEANRSPSSKYLN